MSDAPIKAKPSKTRRSGKRRSSTSATSANSVSAASETPAAVTPAPPDKGHLSERKNSAKANSLPESRQSLMSIRSMQYNEQDGVIMVKEVEGTALDSDEYYEHLYEDLIDAEGATASRLVSKETVQIKFEDEKSEMCNLCKMKFSDCPHITEAAQPVEKATAEAKGPAAETVKPGKLRIVKKKKKASA